MTGFQFISRGFGMLGIFLANSIVLAASFTPLGDLPGGSVYGLAYGISATGRTTVVGFSSSSSGNEAFRWTNDGGMLGLGHLNEIDGYFNDGSARGVTADGRTVVGYSNGEAFRWTSKDGMVSLGAGSAWAVSADGRTIAGNAELVAGQWSAGVWTEAAGFVSLGFQGLPLGISADGTVVAGERQIPYQQGTFLFTDEAFRWTSDGGAVGLGDLPGGAYRSSAYGVSADGKVVVGTSDIGRDSGGFPQTEAFRWTEANGMVGLGHLPGGGSSGFAWAASSDGSIVVGESDSAHGREAFIWTEASGMLRLADLLIANGVTALDGWTLESAIAISPNGWSVAGYGINPLGQVEAYKASIVTFVFTGFSAPVRNLPALNKAKAGRTIPLKWRVTDSGGAPVTTLTSADVLVTSKACEADGNGDSVKEYAPGKSSLQNLGDGYYQFNWKTPKSYARSCKTIEVSLGDGEVHTAAFRFTS